MTTTQKMTKSGSITMEESEIIKIDAEQTLIAAKIANADRVKPIRIDSRTIIFVKAKCENAFERYMAKLNRRKHLK